MREILFRAKRKDDGKWVYGDLTHVIRITPNRDKKCIRVGGYDVDESTIGQFTGMLDSNGEKIFEGDIVEFKNHLKGLIGWEDRMASTLIRFEKSVVDNDAALQIISPAPLLHSNKACVIGNKYDCRKYEFDD